ncbi:hypothetical protein IV203_034509 [Nitzschia inconspicua]|uniref:Uncharacterized protein n=1 Tax=Nitzschia inconspicua TaxID=303405 RepID=A0A9K3K5F0_9STRA|nr:hypothetical protein IV203_002694 [Nitzschia inconspicua]KAG7339512.1 hypothetical protein IV203_002565 [Nitzschia inconspicua]KAG7359411.1 hypothetical protein IV203_034509 [Nitzschia inconspicua]
MQASLLADEEGAGSEGDDDSNESADEANELTESMIEANLERLGDSDNCVEFSEANPIKDLKDTASVPQPPSDYVPPAVKTEKGEPKWEELNNPGDWSRYCFNPSFNKSGSYISHSLPTGALPAPLDNGVRQCTSWTFLYKDWKMKDHWKSDGLFAPNVDRSEEPNDPRKSYYPEVMRWTKNYAHHIGLGGSYGHRFKEVMIPELVHFDGILIRDGVLGGSTDGAIYRRWQTKSPAFDPDTSSSLTHTRFLQLKRTLKFNDINVCHNVRGITETASLDLCGDKSSCSHQGWGETGAGIIARILNKPGITKGGQTVLLVDAPFIAGYAATMTCRRNRLPKNALALAVAVAYDIYKECLTETAAQEYWQLTDLEKKRNKPLFFFDFRDKLSQQACWYSPVNQYYPGDKNFRVVTAMSKRKKEHITTNAQSNCFISEEQYNEIKKKMKLDNTCFCGNLTKIKKHFFAKELIMH